MTEATIKRDRHVRGKKGDAVVGDDTSAGMLRMDDVAAALETMMMRDARLDSPNSTTSSTDSSSCQTSTPTPPHATLSSEASTSGSSTPTQASGGGPKRRGVRFADECGSELVAKAVETTDWWDDMVFGVDRCPSCGHLGTSAAVVDTGNRNRGEESTEELSVCEHCGASYRTLPPGELLQFIEELSEGVEATLLEPTFIGKKRTRVLLYTEDKGQSICWFETGSKQAREPYCLPCKTLEGVKDCSELARRKRKGRIAGSRLRGHGRLSADDAVSGAVSNYRATPFHVPQFEATSSSEVDADYYQDIETSDSATTTASTPAEEACSGEATARVSQGGYTLGGGGSSGGGRDIRIKLRWRVKPTEPLKKVTIVDVRCSNPVVFTRGMLQLLEHNTDLLK
ncbi:unnamed protein product [Ascophyllum nodosum]